MKFLSDILAKAGLTVDGVVTLNNTATGQTPAANDNSTKLATTAWVRTFVQPYSLPIASASILGGIKVGTGLSIDSGTGILSVTGASASSIKSTQTFVVTEGQTVFTVTNGYSVGLIDIFLNGVYLSPNQSTATNGSTFTLNDAPAAGDIIDVIVVSPVYQGTSTTTDQLPEGVVNLYYTNARARAAITLTVNGSSGASTYSSSTGVLNVPTYTLAGLGGIGGSGTTGYVSKFTNSTTIGNSLIYDNGFGIGINTSSPYNSSFYSLDVNGALLVKNVGKTANITLINSDPAGGGNNAFVIHTVGGTFGDSYVDIQGYYGASITGSTTIRLNAAGGNLLVGSLIGTGTRMVVASSTGVLSTQDIVTYVSQVKHQVKSAQVITKGQAVYVSSADGTNMIVSKASNAVEMTSSKTMGLLDASVSINGFANVVTEGLLAGLNTASANAGDPVWLGTDGNLIYGLLNKPSAPAHLVFIGIVTRANSNNGEIFVKVQNGYELDELHDLSVKNPSDGDMIKYVASTGLWTKVAASTTNIVEGTNLYYTDARVGTYLTNNSYATQSYVNTAVSNLVDAAPGTLDTLNELAAALGDDPNFATTVATSIGTKQAQLSGTGFVKVSGTTVSYDNSTYYLASNPNGYITGISFANVSAKPTTIAGYGITDSLVYTTSTYSNPSWITDLAWSKITGAPAFITGYTETDTLASVTARGASTSTALSIAGVTITSTSGGIAYLRPSASNGSILLGDDSGSTARGLLVQNNGGAIISTAASGQVILDTQISGTSVLRVNGNQTVTILGNTVWHQGNLTNLNQLTNGPGYITGITSGNVTTALGYTPMYQAAQSGVNVNAFNGTGLYRGSTGDWSNRPTVVHNGGALLQIDTHPGNYHQQLFFDTGGNRLYMRSADAGTWGSWVTMWHSGNLTNLNQLSNGPGYITGYTETDTLATVTSRGASTSTNLSFTGNLSFGSSTRQMITLWGSVYGIGVQSGTQYYRADDNFAWFRDGVHSDTTFDPGSGGVLVMKLDSSSNLTVTGTVNTTAASSRFGNLLIGQGTYKNSIQPVDDVNMNLSTPSGAVYVSNILYINGSTAWHAGNLTNLSQLSNGPGYITSALWSNVSAGYRENYDLGFRPSNSSSSYAGFRFGTVGNDADAGYLLVRGGADSDVYTQGGITLVADAGWLTLAQRTSSSKGVRIMTGSSTSSTRLEIATSGMTTINSGLVVTSGLAWNDGTPALSVGGNGDARLQVRHIWGKDAGTSGKDHLWLNYSTGGNHVQIGSSGEGNNLYVAGTVYVGGYFSGNAVIHSGNIGSQSVSSATNSTYLFGNDLRTISPSSHDSYRLRFGFTSWTNNNNAPWADYLHLRSYSDGSGGSDNLVMFLKSGIGMRIWQQSFGSGTAYSSYVDVLHSGNYTSYALSTGGGSVNGSVKVTSGSNDASGFTNSDLGSAFYTDRGGRLLTSNGTNWASDGRDPALVISGSYSDTNRGRIGLALHNETTSNNAFAPMIAFSTRSQSGSYNTVYASIMGRYTGYNTGVDTNWAKGELHFYAHGDAYVDDTPTMKLTGAGFLQIASGGGSSTATLSLLQTGYSNAYVNYSGGRMTIGGDSGLSDGIYFNMYNGSGYGDRVIIKPSGRVNIIQGSRTLSLGDGNYANHILCDSNVDFAFNYNNGSTGGFGFFGGTGSAKFMCSYTGTLTVAGDVIAYGTPSDARLKDIKEKVPNALESVLKLNGYKFDWKEREQDIYGDDKTILHIKEDIGVIAQEVEILFPELARTNEDGYMSVRYQGLTAVLIEAMKEQQTQIESQKSEIEELKDLVKQLINR